MQPSGAPGTNVEVVSGAAQYKLRARETVLHVRLCRSSPTTSGGTVRRPICFRTSEIIENCARLENT
eukprot:11586476-Alexandrium_andersonii.AAC.1